MVETILISAYLLLVYFAYFEIATKYNITDKPNHRSSHVRPVIRGGGIIFLFAVLASVALGYLNIWIAAAILIVGIASFIDDIITISQFPRLGIQVVSILIIFWQTGTLTNSIVIIVIATILFLAWVNIYNFMDGINGILILYSITILLSLFYLSESLEQSKFIEIIILAALIFAFFNVRKKAKVFAGDVGSISMAFIIGYLMLVLIQNTGRWEYILFFSVFGIDAGFTILNRLIKKENILQAHRSHLYQYMANEAKIPQLATSFIYAGIQAIINILVIWLIQDNRLTPLIVIIILFGLSIIYLLARFKVYRKFVL